MKISRLSLLLLLFVFASATSNAAQAAEVRNKGPRVAALINLPSANGNIWDIDDSEGYVDDGSQDAFDSYGGLRIEVKDAGNATLQSSSVVANLALVASGTNRLVTTTPFFAAGVSVSRRVYAIPGSNVLRYLDTLTNSSGAVRKVRIAFGAANGDLGSDGNTHVAGTSSGDLLITTADNWMVSTDQLLPTAAVDDPPVGVAWSNRAAASFIGSGDAGDPLTTAFAGDGDDGFSPVYDFTLNPGETKVLAHFVYRGLSEGGSTGGESRIAPAAAGAERALALSTIAGVVSAPNFADLSTPEQALIYNWALAVAEPPIAVPTLDRAALPLIVLLLAISTLIATRRRRALKRA
ncbi:MAG: hypothetical protein ABIZ64_12940 [Casimicrobium sp.]